MPAPTKEQLDRYMDLVVDGEEHEDAALVVWGDEPEPEPEAKPKTPVVMVTEFHDGIVIGWDTCSALNNGCGRHIAKCKCKGGPKSLKVFEKWHELPDSMPNYGATILPSTSTTLVVSEPGVSDADTLPAGGSQVPCVLGQHLADIANTDKNDDGSYSCFDCQEKGLQRGPQVDG